MTLGRSPLTSRAPPHFGRIVGNWEVDFWIARHLPSESVQRLAPQVNAANLRLSAKQRDGYMISAVFEPR